MERFDVVVVGAGPAGSTAARFAAEGGARTLLLDQRPRIGSPVQCGEFLPTPDELADLLPCPDVIREAFEIPASTVLRRTATMVCVAPDGRRYRFPLDGVSVDRTRFDPALAQRAVAAGADLRHPIGVTAVSPGRVQLATGATLEARVIVAADGPLSTVGRGVGFAPARHLYRMITSTVPGEFPPQIDLHFGTVAPGGYAWVIPKEGSANVGLGVSSVPAGSSLSRLLDRFTAAQGMAPATDRTRWWVPIGPPPASAVCGGALFCGDAANLVMATNGGGIPTAILSGRDAGVVAAAHVARGMPLTEYDRLWRAHLFAPLDRGYRLKRLGDRVVHRDRLLALGMRYIGSAGLDAMMRLRWPRRLGGLA
jgi:digeranylgeranylglycerophospholipid reductase